MSHLQDLGKVASGLAMVVKESIKRAPNVSITPLDVLKAVTGTVTDFTGLTQGRVKDLGGHRKDQKPEIQTSAAPASSRESYLFKPLDSLGPPRRPVVPASRTDEVLSKVKEDILPSVAESPISKPLENFTTVDSNRAHDRKEEAAKLDSEAIKAEQVLQASRPDGAFHLSCSFFK